MLTGLMYVCLHGNPLHIRLHFGMFLFVPPCVCFMLQVAFILIEKSISVPSCSGLLLVCFLRAVVESLLVHDALPWLSWWVYPNTGRERLARMAALPLTSQCGEALHWTETGPGGGGYSPTVLSCL